MNVLSTLRPLSPHLLERLWRLLSGSFPASIEYPLTLCTLNDDCLLLILNHLSVAQLFPLRAASRRLCHFIERYNLPKCRTLIYGYDKANGEKSREHSGTVEVYLSHRQHVYSDFCKQIGSEKADDERFLPVNDLFSVRLSALPLSLPLLLPRLTCLTWTHFLVDQVELPTDEQSTVNRLLLTYLNSHWSTSLVSLHLYIEVPPMPQPDNTFFEHLNRLLSLRHLYIDFSRFINPEDGFLLPSSIPILCQMYSFSLHFYGGSNTASLLAQLGPDLSFLSLVQVTYSTDQFAAFLAAKPTYRQTLKVLELHSRGNFDWEFLTLTAQCLFSLTRFSCSVIPTPDVDPFAVFLALSHLPNLEEIIRVPLTFAQLRALRVQHHRLGSMPQLRSIHRAKILLFNHTIDTFLAEELFNDLLPLLPAIFCCLEDLDICVVNYNFHRPVSQYENRLRQQLSTRVKELFPGLHHCSVRW